MGSCSMFGAMLWASLMNVFRPTLLSTPTKRWIARLGAHYFSLPQVKQKRHGKRWTRPRNTTPRATATPSVIVLIPTASFLKIPKSAGFSFLTTHTSSGARLLLFGLKGLLESRSHAFARGKPSERVSL